MLQVFNLLESSVIINANVVSDAFVIFGMHIFDVANMFTCQ